MHAWRLSCGCGLFLPLSLRSLAGRRSDSHAVNLGAQAFQLGIVDPLWAVFKRTLRSILLSTFELTTTRKYFYDSGGFVWDCLSHRFLGRSTVCPHQQAVPETQLWVGTHDWRWIMLVGLRTALAENFNHFLRWFKSNLLGAAPVQDWVFFVFSFGLLDLILLFALIFCNFIGDSTHGLRQLSRSPNPECPGARCYDLIRGAVRHPEIWPRDTISTAKIDTSLI